MEGVPLYVSYRERRLERRAAPHSSRGHGVEGGLIHIPTSSKGVVRKEGYCMSPGPEGGPVHVSYF